MRPCSGLTVDFVAGGSVLHSAANMHACAHTGEQIAPSWVARSWRGHHRRSPKGASCWRWSVARMFPAAAYLMLTASASHCARSSAVLAHQQGPVTTAQHDLGQNTRASRSGSQSPTSMCVAGVVHQSSSNVMTCTALKCTLANTTEHEQTCSKADVPDIDAIGTQPD